MANNKIISFIDVAKEMNFEILELLEKILYNNTIQNSNIKFYLKPKKLYAHLWAYKKTDGSIFEKKIEFDSTYFRRTKLSISNPINILEPLQLSERNLQNLLEEGEIEEDVFFANDTLESEMDRITYFKLCDQIDYGKNYVLNITIDKLYLLENDLENVKNISSIKLPENVILKKPKKILSDNERDKLLKVIGILTWYISSKANKLKKLDKPNFANISSELTILLDELKKEKNLDTLGLAPTSLKKRLSDGIQALEGKNF